MLFCATGPLIYRKNIYLVPIKRKQPEYIAVEMVDFTSMPAAFGAFRYALLPACEQHAQARYQLLCII